MSIACCSNTRCVICSGFKELGPGDDFFFQENGLYFHYAIDVKKFNEDSSEDVEDIIDKTHRKGPYNSKRDLLAGFIRYMAELVEQSPDCSGPLA
jgi:hypothetical protein